MEEIIIPSEQKIGFQLQFNCKVGEHVTKFVVHRFTNKYMVLITQYGALPNLYMVQFDAKDERADRIAPVNLSEFHTSVPVTMKCLLGVDKVEVRAGIQFLINRTQLSRSPIEIIFCLGLRDMNGDILKAIANILDQKL
ncbi:unnamed protein product [Ceratitis capitata]|uniref:(Mediterranean fruit fly) hypothetical protein n=1 Tax=Ceratitis capitata TaxID=7213 RepID=A0A811UIW6_CERCA|nr:unnamed protein product [Ceratitis capitata]